MLLAQCCCKPTLLDVLAWVMLLGTTAVVFVTSARSPLVLATYRGEVIDQRDANLCKEGKKMQVRRWCVQILVPGKEYFPKF